MVTVPGWEVDWAAKGRALAMAMAAAATAAAEATASLAVEVDQVGRVEAQGLEALELVA